MNSTRVPRQRIRRIPALLAGILLAAVTVSAAPAAHGQQAEQRNFNANISGAQEVPPVDTAARGQIKLQLSKDATELHYRLIVANLDNVTQAHLHKAPAGANGPVVAWLYPQAPPAQLIPGTTNGVLATGTLTDANLVGPLAGASLADLVTAIRDGEIYVNVHTSQFPGGEIRGQLR